MNIVRRIPMTYTDYVKDVNGLAVNEADPFRDEVLLEFYETISTVALVEDVLAEQGLPAYVKTVTPGLIRGTLDYLLRSSELHNAKYDPIYYSLRNIRNYDSPSSYIVDQFVRSQHGEPLTNSNLKNPVFA